MVDKDKIIKLYKQGLSKRQIAIKCKCSRAYVYKILQQKGLIESTYRWE